MRSRVAAAFAAILALTLLPSLPALADDPAPDPTATAATATQDGGVTIAASAYVGGQVSIDNTTTPFVADDEFFPDGTTFTYRWLRGDTSLTATTNATGAGAATQNYTPDAADWGKFLRVKVTATVPGYSSAAVVFSAAADYSLRQTAPNVIEGSQHVSAQHIADPATYNHAGATEISYRWYRNGVAISGAIGASYTAVAADLGKVLTVKTTATAPGWVGGTFTSTPTNPIQIGDFQGSHEFHITGPVANVLTAEFEEFTIIDLDPGTGDPAVTFQWRRNGTAIAGATHATYTLTPADNATTTSVDVLVKKPGYISVPMSQAITATMNAASPAQLFGVPAVGHQLQVTTPDFLINGATVTPAVTYRWLRDGAVIAGQTFDTYTPTSVGHVYTGQVIATLPDVPPLTLAASTLKLGINAFTMSDVGLHGAGINGRITATPGVSPAGTSTYQWYRNGTAISGATKQVYALTTADLGTMTRVRVTTTKSGYTPVVQYSVSADWSLVPDGVPSIVPAIADVYEVGQVMSVDRPTFHAADVGLTWATTDTCRWYRSGIAIAGATSCTYALAAADVGKTITVKVTGSADGLNQATAASLATPVVAKGVFEEVSGGAVPIVVPGTAAAQLKATLPSGQVITPGVTLAYQWTRNGAAISGATKQTFTLASTDGAKQIAVKVTISKPGFTTIARTSVPDSYGLTFGGLGGGCSSAVGDPCSTAPMWQNAHGDLVTPATTKFQWYRQGVAIAGATAPAYIFQTGDYGKAPFSVKVSVSGPGIVAASVTMVANYFAVGAGHVGAQGEAGFDGPGTTGILTALIVTDTMVPASPAPALTYQWYRGATPIPGATKKTYTLSASLDREQLISVRIGVTRVNFESPANVYTLVSPQHDFTAYLGTPAAFSSTPIFGSPVTAPVQEYTDVDHNVLNPSTVSYQWYRAHIADGSDRAPITGATKITYTPTAADVGAYLFVRYTAKVPGYLAPTVTTAGPSPQVAGLDLGYNSTGEPTITSSPSSLLLTAHAAAASNFAVAPTTWSYQWTRGGGSIPGATKSTYTMTAADFGHLISVKVTHGKPGYQPVTVAVSTPVDRSLTFSDVSSVTGTPTAGQVLTAHPAALSPALTGVTYLYQWKKWDTALSAFVPIPGATGQAYKVTTADATAHRTVSAFIRPVKAGWLSEYSGATSVVVGP